MFVGVNCADLVGCNGICYFLKVLIHHLNVSAPAQSLSKQCDGSASTTQHDTSLLLYTVAVQRQNGRKHCNTTSYNFAFGASSVGSIRSRISPAASLR